mgnify:FL=1
MQFLKSISITICLILSIGCGDLLLKFKEDKFTDDDLIIKIQNATNKIEIEFIELPNEAKSTVNSDYSTETFLSELHASGLGYELTYAKLNSENNEFKKIYFNLEGKKLESSKEKKHWDCFEMIFPLTFNMPDESFIVVSENTDEGWGELKNWYELNPNIKFEWDLQYPVDILMQNGNLITVNNLTEMIQIKENCE